MLRSGRKPLSTPQRGLDAFRGEWRNERVSEGGRHVLDPRMRPDGPPVEIEDRRTQIVLEGIRVCDLISLTELRRFSRPRDQAGVCRRSNMSSTKARTPERVEPGCRK
jgi:hypothetical protein